MNMNFVDLPSQAQNQNKTHEQVQAASKNASSKKLTAFEKKAHETATNFEAVFLSQILKSMSMGLKSDGPFGGGHGEEIFRDVMNEQMSTQIARTGGIGISDSIYREILKSQEVGHPNVK